MYETSGQFDPYEVGKVALQEEVIADGGLLGLFGHLRTDAGTLLEKYQFLLEAAASPDEREKRRGAYIDTPDALDDDLMAVASMEGLHPDDVVAMLIAVKLYQTAFPGVPLNAKPVA